MPRPISLSILALFLFSGLCCASPRIALIGNPSGDSSSIPSSVYYPIGTSNGRLIHDGLLRTFVVHVPPSYTDTTPMPLVLMFHGGFGNGAQFEKNSDMDTVADREGFITVYPNGLGAIRTWNGGRCCGAAAREDIDDVGFVSELIDHLESSLAIDPARIYAAGMSNGAIFCHRLACELADKIAAIGPVEGTIMVDDCTPSRPVPVIIIHGTADQHVPWNGGYGCGFSDVEMTSVPDTIAIWKKADGCTSDEKSPYIQMGDGTGEYQGDCQADIVLCTIYGGGHHWPGGTSPTPWFFNVQCPDDGPMSTTFIANEVLWKFFKDHPME